MIGSILLTLLGLAMVVVGLGASYIIILAHGMAAAPQPIDWKGWLVILVSLAVSAGGVWIIGDVWFW